MTARPAVASAPQLFIPLALAPQACRPPPGGAVRLALDGDTMGTYWKVVLYARPEAAGLGALRTGIEDVLARVIAEMSPWQPSSAISRFNAAPAGTWHTLPEGFAHVLDRALEIAALTEGAYDPTLGALTDAWGFGPSGARSVVPDAGEADRLRHMAGYGRLTFDRTARRLRQPGGLHLDLNAIAKGYAVDLLSNLLTAQGHDSHLVEIGGELFGHGLKPDGTPWWVSLDGGASPGRAALTGVGIATSGSSIRHVERERRRYSHILEGGAGRPVDDSALQVTVLADSGMTADGLATALLALGAERGATFAAHHGIAARFTRGREETLSPALTAMLD